MQHLIKWQLDRQLLQVTNTSDRTLIGGWLKAKSRGSRWRLSLSLTKRTTA